MNQELGIRLQKHQMPVIEENDISLQPNIEPIYENINTYSSRTEKFQVNLQNTNLEKNHHHHQELQVVKNCQCLFLDLCAHRAFLDLQNIRSEPVQSSFYGGSVYVCSTDFSTYQ